MPPGRLYKVRNERASSLHFARTLADCLRAQGQLERCQMLIFQFKRKLKTWEFQKWYRVSTTHNLTKQLVRYSWDTSFDDIFLPYFCHTYCENRKTYKKHIRELHCFSLILCLINFGFSILSIRSVSFRSNCFHFCNESSHPFHILFLTFSVMCKLSKLNVFFWISLTNIFGGFMFLSRIMPTLWKSITICFEWLLQLIFYLTK